MARRSGWTSGGIAGLSGMEVADREIQTQFWHFGRRRALRPPAFAHAHWEVLIQSVTTGRVRYERNADSKPVVRSLTVVMLGQSLTWLA